MKLQSKLVAEPISGSKGLQSRPNLLNSNQDISAENIHQEISAMKNQIASVTEQKDSTAKDARKVSLEDKRASNAKRAERACVSACCACVAHHA